jgi:methionyl-tRNA formyltransferase
MNSLIFFGSDQYSAIVLLHLLDPESKSDLRSGFVISAVVTDQSKPVGREQKVEPNPVEKLAITHNLKVLYYPDKKEEMNNFIDMLRSTTYDLSRTTQLVGLCASFDHLVPAGIIDLFGGNLFNLHPSLLPQYRNVSPVQYAIALSDTETGITLFRISSGIDNGEIIAQVAAPILPTDTTPTLTSRLFPLGAQLFLNFLSGDLEHGSKDALRSGFGNEPLVFTHRLTRDSGYLEWLVLQKLLSNQPVSPDETTNELLKLRLTHHPKGEILVDLLHALTPWPGVWTLATTKKGKLRISIVPNPRSTIHDLPSILIAGKPNPIAWPDFTKYYIND